MEEEETFNNEGSDTGTGNDSFHGESSDRGEEGDLDTLEETGNDSHVAAYRDFIIQMEREIAGSPDGDDLKPVPDTKKSGNNGLPVPRVNISDRALPIPSLTTSPPPGCRSSHKTGHHFRNRVEPFVERETDNLETEVTLNRSVEDRVSLQSMTDIFPSPRRPLITSDESESLPEYERGGKTTSPDSGVEHDMEPSGVVERCMSKQSLAMMGSKRRREDANYSRQKVFVRSFKERSSQEKFALYGLLTPALCLVPSVDGTDALTACFTELKGEDRELKLAAAHIDDAITGRGKYGRARAFFKSPHGRWCFNVLVSKWFHYFVLIMATLHIALTFIEPPPDPESTSLGAIILTPLCLLAYIADVAIHIGFLSWRVFWRWNENKWQRVEFVFVIMFTLDYIMLVLQWALRMRLLQVFRCLRAAIILVKLKNVQHVYEVVMSIVVKLGKVFLIIIIFILMFSAIGVNLFKGYYHCIGQNETLTNCTESAEQIYTGSFDNVAITFLRLFVLLSTENYPELMIPAYSQNKITFIYFGIFLFVGVFFLTAILLAIVVDSYWEFAKKYVKEERARERAELAKAWNLLDPLGKGSLPISDERFLKLFKILKPDNTEDMNMQLIAHLDSNNDGEIDSLEWTLRLNETLSFEFEVENFRRDQCGPEWMRTVGGFAQKIFRSDIFARIILMLIIAHCALFCLTWYNMPKSLSTGIQITKTGIMVIFMLEILLSVWGECLNLLQVIEVLDISLNLVALGANIAWYFSTEKAQGLCNVIGGLAVAFRVGFNSLQTKRIVLMFFTKIFPVMSDLLLLILIIGYFYAVVGWESFSHVSPNLSFEAGHYNYECGLGFETFWCSLLIVFQIVTTSNWHEIMNSAMVSSSTWTCIYFVTCFVVINMVVMNLFVAIAIEAFNKLGKEKELVTENTMEDTEGAAEEATIADSAKTFINNLLETTTTEQTKDRVQMKAIGTPKMRRPSTVSITSPNVPLPGLDFGISDSPNQLLAPINRRTAPIGQHNAPVSLPPAPLTEEPGVGRSSSEEEDLSHLTPQQRKKKMMKKRQERKRRKKRALHTVVVVTAFRPSKDQEIALNVGDHVDVLQKQDDWWEGRAGSQQGWFPASHVKKFNTNVQPMKTRHLSLDSSNMTSRKPKTRSLSDSAAPGRSQSVVHPPTFESTDTLNTSLGSTGGKTSRPKLKLRSTGNWRKEILGDITVINPQELRELNKILKAQHSISSTSNFNSTVPTRKMMSISGSIEEEIEPDVPVPVSSKTPSPPKRPMLPPRISFERAPTLPLLTEEEEEKVSSKTQEHVADANYEADKEDMLTVELPSLPADLRKKRNKEQNKGGEMPSWMAKFVETNNLNITSDVKFEEEARKVEEERLEPATEDSIADSTAPKMANYAIPGIVVEEDSSM